jgi:hypothetical protein
MGKVNVITESRSTAEQDEDENFIVVESQVSVAIHEQVRILNTLSSHFLSRFVLLELI